MERRSLPRYQVNWPIKFSVTNPEGVRVFGAGALENVSASGAFIAVDKPLWLGAQIDLSIKMPLPQDAWMLYSAEVLRIQSADSGGRVAVAFSPSRPVFSDME
ncbi:MAG TPA: PilZ domain-containing protein [Blastocatellia bacterium]|nr:PilZ domain-containing protein [Blastocatellia bacterium]